ncbi:uncharacterized protein LOC122374382 [Amphibalanus amphitrite]|uniref:uncharacterized protein LOC122374382 n=1 Tax=Amphibalanus amphitrite TaxID=1232801 RepID=UPI001C915358|nr:uncharacterized protein LOC122374382 [Amphibalanus amphitrite]
MVRRCSLTLSLAALLLQLLIMALFLALRNSQRRDYGQFYNVDAGEILCIRRPELDVSENNPSRPLVLAPCEKYGHNLDNTQRFRMDFEGHLFSPVPSSEESQREFCVGSDLRLGGCKDEREEWVFTQGSGLVHVESAQCLTREPGSRLSLRSCDNRPEQYWWYQLEGHAPPV